MLTLQGNVRTIAEDADELGVMIRAVRRKKGGEGVYCVTRSELTQGLMEIIPLKAILTSVRIPFCVFARKL